MTRPSTLVMVTLVAVGAVVLAVVFASRFGSDPSLSPSPLIGQQAPDTDLRPIGGGEAIQLSDFGGDVVVVNFWAPWCVPCHAEHGALLSIAEGFDEFGVTVLGITYQSDEDAAMEFLDELGHGYPVVMDDRSRAAIGFGLRGVPETYFIDRDGVVVAKVTGPVTADLAANTLDRIILGLDPDPAEG